MRPRHPLLGFRRKPLVAPTVERCVNEAASLSGKGPALRLECAGLVALIEAHGALPEAPWERLTPTWLLPVPGRGACSCTFLAVCPCVQ